MISSPNQAKRLPPAPQKPPTVRPKSQSAGAFQAVAERLRGAHSEAAVSSQERSKAEQLLSYDSLDPKSKRDDDEGHAGVREVGQSEAKSEANEAQLTPSEGRLLDLSEWRTQPEGMRGVPELQPIVVRAEQDPTPAAWIAGDAHTGKAQFVLDRGPLAGAQITVSSVGKHVRLSVDAANPAEVAAFRARIQDRLADKGIDLE
jgi:hypothetical protein